MWEVEVDDGCAAPEAIGSVSDVKAKLASQNCAISRTDYTAQDRPLVEEMRRMLVARPLQAKSAWDAALISWLKGRRLKVSTIGEMA
jgi:hypothetical protein